MSVNKVKNMLRPSDFWRIGEHESLFSDMAQEGFHLKKVGIIFFKFTIGKPKQMKYRIDLSQGQEVTPEQKDMYVESGWDYVTSYGDFNVFSSPVEANAPELYTDSAEQAYTLNYLSKKLTNATIVVAVAVALMIVMLGSTWIFNPTRYLSLVDGLIIQQIILLIAELNLTYNSLQAAISIRALRNNLLEGKSVNHSAPWKRRYKVKLIEASICTILAVFALTLAYMSIIMNETNTLPIASNNLPIVRLADIEQNPKLARKKSSYIHDNIEWGNHYSYNWSLLAPLQYQSDEQGIVPNEMYKDGSGTYSPSLHCQVYKLKIPNMNDGVLSDLIKRYGDRSEGGEFLEVEHSSFNKLIVHEGDYLVKEIFGYKGKCIIYVRYYGNADMDSVIRATVEKVTLISE